MLGTFILVALVLLFLGALPSWPHSTSWGYAPSGTLGAVLVAVLILVLLNKLRKSLLIRNQMIDMS
jgi:hypothetical protein